MRLERAFAHHLWLLVLLIVKYNVSGLEDDAFPSPPTSSTLHPETFRTGKLNQFQGFFTPKPYPDNANFVYASIWASWSAWSFCSNNVRVRVRACNTVRGFTCPGANQERRSCAESANQQSHSNLPARPQSKFGGDYDTVDPWEEDRKEALKQLYSDYVPTDETSTLVPNSFQARAGGRTATVYTKKAPPGVSVNNFRQKIQGKKPQILFGSKLEDSVKRINVTFEDINSNETLDSHSIQKEGHIVSLSSFTGSPLRINPAKNFDFDDITNQTQHSTVSPDADNVSTTVINKSNEDDMNHETTSTISSLEVLNVLTENKTSPNQLKPIKLKLVKATQSTANKKLNKNNHRTVTIKLNSGEVYDDEVQQERTTEEKDHQDAADVDEENLSQTNEVLHSGEIIINKDTVNGLKTLMKNTTKATENVKSTASKENVFPDEQKETQSMSDVEKTYKTTLHSGEVNFDVPVHSGEFEGIENASDDKSNLKKVNAKAHGSQIQQIFIEEKPVKIKGILPRLKKKNGADYQKSKIIKPAQFQIRPDPETIRLESELRILQADMAKIEADLTIIETEKTESQFVRTTQKPHLSIKPIQHEMTLSPEDINKKAMDLELVPQLPLKTSFSEALLPAVLPSIINTNNGDMFVLGGLLPKSKATWSNWQKWGNCFCGKQVRTRVCNYDSALHSEGCIGKSFESRVCEETKPCPAKLPLIRTTSTLLPLSKANFEGIYTMSPPRSRAGYAFKPNPLNRAISNNCKLQALIFFI